MIRRIISPRGNMYGMKMVRGHQFWHIPCCFSFPTRNPEDEVENKRFIFNIIYISGVVYMRGCKGHLLKHVATSHKPLTSGLRV